MLSFEEIKADLDETQLKLNAALDDNENSNEAVALSEKMTKIVVWLMQHGYVQA